MRYFPICGKYLTPNQKRYILFFFVDLLKKNHKNVIFNGKICEQLEKIITYVDFNFSGEDYVISPGEKTNIGNVIVFFLRKNSVPSYDEVYLSLLRIFLLGGGFPRKACNVFSPFQGVTLLGHILSLPLDLENKEYKSVLFVALLAASQNLEKLEEVIDNTKIGIERFEKILNNLSFEGEERLLGKYTTVDLGKTLLNLKKILTEILYRPDNSIGFLAAKEDFYKRQRGEVIEEEREHQEKREKFSLDKKCSKQLSFEITKLHFCYKVTTDLPYFRLFTFSVRESNFVTNRNWNFFALCQQQKGDEEYEILSKKIEELCKRVCTYISEKTATNKKEIFNYIKTFSDWPICAVFELGMEGEIVYFSSGLYKVRPFGDKIFVLLSGAFERNYIEGELYKVDNYLDKIGYISPTFCADFIKEYQRNLSTKNYPLAVAVVSFER